MTMIGAQLYTVRDYIQTEKDIERTLSMVAQMGYRTIQVSGMGKIEPQKLRSLCDKLNLQIVLTHNPWERILDDTDRLIEEHNILGCDYIGLGGMPMKYRSPWWIDKFIEDFKEPARKIAAAGKLLMYHNHAFEFEKIEGKRFLETLAEAFSPKEMGFTLDTYWVQAAGGDVCWWLDFLKGRTPCVHLKDMTVCGQEQRMAPVGAGNMNFSAILEKIKELGDVKYLLVEQDDCYGDPFACLQKSFHYLHTMELC